MSLSNALHGLPGVFRRRQARDTEPQFSDPRLARRRLLYVLALALLAYALWTQYALIFVCGMLVLGITAIPEIWYRFGVNGLTVTREIEHNRANFGDVVTIPQTLENRSPLPLPMVETTDEFPEALPVLAVRLGLSSRNGAATFNRTMRLWSYQRLRRRYYVRATQRGAYTFGPTIARVSDPFGVLTREVSFDTKRVLLVHPLVAPLERFGISPRALFGEHDSRIRLLEDPLRIAGVREYAPGDDPRRVHWKATARLGTLQSKVLDPTTQRTLIIALDVRTYSRVQMGWDPDLAEYGIAVAASVAMWATRHGYAVGMIANGVYSPVSPDAEGRPERVVYSTRDASVSRLHLAPSARPEQLTRILDGLSRVILFGGAPMGPLLAQELRSAPNGSSVVYVGLESLIDTSTLITLRKAQINGRGVSFVLTTRGPTDPHAESEDERGLHVTGFPIFRVGGRERWHALLTEALHGEAPRSATDAVSDARLNAERDVIRRKRQERIDTTHRAGAQRSATTTDQQERSEDVDHAPTPAHI